MCMQYRRGWNNAAFSVFRWLSVALARSSREYASARIRGPVISRIQCALRADGGVLRAIVRLCDRVCVCVCVCGGQIVTSRKRAPAGRFLYVKLECSLFWFWEMTIFTHEHISLNAKTTQFLCEVYKLLFVKIFISREINIKIRVATSLGHVRCVFYNFCDGLLELCGDWLV